MTQVTHEDVYRLLGLIEGEACFAISRNTGNSRRSYVCKFLLKMRADDEAFVRSLAETFGIGRVFVRQPSVTDGHARKPFVQWSVERKEECTDVVDLIDAHGGLRSKKARDYAIWREAVLAWRRQDWAVMGDAFDRLAAVRQYRPLEVAA